MMQSSDEKETRDLQAKHQALIEQSSKVADFSIFMIKLMQRLEM